MWKIKAVCIALFLVVLAQPLFALTDESVLENRFKQYLNEVRVELKEIEDPVQKRHTLGRAIRMVIRSLERVEDMQSLTEQEQQQLTFLKQSFQDKYDELNGLNGFQKVADQDLDQFVDYVLQDLEQARDYITISVAAAIIIVLLIILIA